MDDSVVHSWNTVPVRVWVDVDREIAPLVEAFQRLRCVRTFCSCAGHPHSQYETRAYVVIDLALDDDKERDRFFVRLRKLGADLGNGCEFKLGPLPTLLLPPALVPNAARIVGTWRNTYNSIWERHRDPELARIRARRWWEKHEQRRNQIVRERRSKLKQNAGQ